MINGKRCAYMIRSRSEPEWWSGSDWVKLRKYAARWSTLVGVSRALPVASRNLASCPWIVRVVLK